MRHFKGGARKTRLTEILQYAEIVRAAVEAQHLATKLRRNNSLEETYQTELSGIRKFTTSHSYYNNSAFFIALDLFKNDSSLNVHDAADRVSKTPI